MLQKFIDKFLKDDEEVHPIKEIPPTEKPAIKNKFSLITLVIPLIIFLTAFFIRNYSLHYITTAQNPGVEVWYSDVFHHWQISYLSKEIGFHQGFLRLWDLKGMEYFWGLMHPLIGTIIMAIAKTSDILLFRYLSLICGSLNLVLIYLIVKRSFGTLAALGSIIISLLNPVIIFNDASGMVEPLGIFFVLLAIYFFPKKTFFSAVFLALASATRAEYWVLSIPIIFGFLISKTSSANKISFMAVYSFLIILYMKYLLDWTGNPIYPIWWNYMGNAVGKWQAKIPPSIEQLFIQKIYIGILVATVFGIIITIWKKPKEISLWLFGWGNWFIWSIVIGMTAYLLSYLPRFWVDRIMIWPYLFLNILIGVFIFYLIPKILPKFLKIIYYVVFSFLIGIGIFYLQTLWKPIHYYYDPSVNNWEFFENSAKTFKKIGSLEGKILIPEIWPPLTYALYKYADVPGKRLIGQMFDPFYYMTGDPFSNWGENRDTIYNWLKKENIKYLIHIDTQIKYKQLISKEPQWFILLDEFKGLKFYKINLQ